MNRKYKQLVITFDDEFTMNILKSDRFNHHFKQFSVEKDTDPTEMYEYMKAL